MMRWAFDNGKKAFFFPDEHLGRFTAHVRMGIPLEKIVLYNPFEPGGGLTKQEIESARVIVWKGNCVVHMQFNPEHVRKIRELFQSADSQTGIKVIVHPECKLDVCMEADYVGSTEFIRKTIENAPKGSAWAVGTENHMVGRLMKLYNVVHIRPELSENDPEEKFSRYAAYNTSDVKENLAKAEKTVVSLNPAAGHCATMFRITPANLCWVLESLVEGRVVNHVQVPEVIAEDARIALRKMLEVTAARQ
jgi:quinolinate synthase